MGLKCKCYSVRLKSLDSISVRAYKATSFDGSEAILPKSQVFGRDWDVAKSEAYWISAWILEKKEITYSRKKEACFDSETGKMVPTITVTHHTPDKIEATEVKPIKRLKK